jgi:hypothetical protein
MVKIVTFEELEKLTGGSYYDYLSDLIDSLNQEYYDIYIDEYLEDVKYVFNSNGLEMVDVEIEEGNYGSVDDIKIIPHFDQKDEFYKKHEFYCGEIEKIIVKYMGDEKEKKYKSEFISIADFNDNVYYSLYNQTFEYDNEDTIYGYYVYEDIDNIAFTRVLDEMRKNSNAMLDDIISKAKEMIKEAEETTFVNYFEDELVDYINEFEMDYKNDKAESIIDDLFTLDSDEEFDDDETINEFLDGLSEFFYDKSDEYVQHISEEHAEKWEMIFTDFVNKHKISMPMSEDDYIESRLKDFKYKVELDENGDIVEVIEYCQDFEDCE